MQVVIHCKYDELVSPKALKPHPKNRNKHPEHQVERITEILNYQGWRHALTVSKRSGFMTKGHGRLLAAKKMKLKSIPVVYQDYDSDEQEYSDIIADNAIASWAELDLEQIKIDIQDMPDLELGTLGIEGLGPVNGHSRLKVEQEDEVPEDVDPICQHGDLWILGDHRLLCGDSTDEKQVGRLMDEEKADMVFTDPPYGIGFKYNSHQDFTGDEYKNFCKSWFQILKKSSDFIVISTGWAYNKFWYSYDPKECFYWLCRNKRTGGSISHFRKIEPIFIWGKPKNKYDFDFWDQTTQIESELKGKHTCPKPVSLVEAIIHGCKSNGSVLDIFGGSGTTLIACEKTDRKCFMMELDPHYCDVIIKRWENFTGKRAVKQP